MVFLKRIDSSPLNLTKDILEVGSDAILSPIRCIFGSKISYSSANRQFNESLIIKTTSITRFIFSCIALIFSPLALAIGIPMAHVSLSRTKALSAFQRALSPTPPAKPLPLAPQPIPIATAFEKYQALKHLYPKQALAATPEKSEIIRQFRLFETSQSKLDSKDEAEEQFDAKTLNRDFMRRFKIDSGNTLASPDEFLVSMNQSSFKPKPLVTAPSTFLIQEGQPYEIGYSDIEPLNLDTTPHWGRFIKKDKGNLYLYADGYSYGSSLIINGIPHFMSAGHGDKRPYCILKEGDVIATQSRYVGVVDAHGNIIQPTKERLPIVRSQEAITQIHDFHRSIFDENCNYLSKANFSSLKHVGIIREKFEAGFSQISKCGKMPYFYDDIDFKLSTGEELIVFDPTQDPTLVKLKRYFEEEFKFYSFTDLEKITRLNLFLKAVFHSTSTYQFNHHAYLIGELLHSGQGVCRHRAFALKALCDMLDIPITYQAGLINSLVFTQLGEITFLENAGHAWCVYEDEHKEQYLVDPMKGCIVKKQDILTGPETRMKKVLKSSFGF